MSAPLVVDKSSAPYSIWGEDCESWTLSVGPGFHVQLERMPPHTTEKLHYHAGVRQLYIVLGGEATVRLEAGDVRLTERQALPIEPEVPHQMRNESDGELEFLVISSSPPRDDRVDLETGA